MSGRHSSNHSRSLSSFSSGSPSQSHPSTPETDSMHRRSGSGRSSNPNVFSDEYSLEPIDSEQSTLTPGARSPSVSSIASSNTLRGSLRQQGKPYGTVPTDADTTENPFGDDARLSDEDATRSSLPQKGYDVTNRNSIASTNTAPSMTQRSQSTSSRFSMPPRALSPYTGATGPSHPYAMYPQVGVSRSPSVTTTSTIRPPDRPLGDASAPQHPYAMYPQNVVPEEGIETPPVIPLGFPGHTQTYQRPSGRADDDVGDLVGPDGHLEQLPPYSRYPDAAAPKIEGQVDATNDAGVVPDENGTNGPTAIPVSEVSSRTMVTETAALHTESQRQSQSSDRAPATGVMAFEEKLKTKGKKKACCGLPVWTLILVGVIMLVGACIGGVIGGVLGAKKAAEEENEKDDGPNIVTVTTTPKMDATPISTIPANLKSAPTGQFVIPAVNNNQSKFCVVESDYRPAWRCMESGKIPITIEGTDTDRSISFENELFSPSFTYGAQAPLFSSPTQSLSLVMDGSDLSLGPALTFFGLFDKLVILPQDTFSSDVATKRSISEREVLVNPLRRKQPSEAGDRPWFCWWNSTMMEFFLYLNETSRDAQQGSTMSLASGAQATPVSDSGKSRRDLSVPYYPRRIKMSEKRDYPEAPSPYCEQMQVMDNGSLSSVSDTTIKIKELEPTPTTTVGGIGSSTQTYTAMAQYESVCYCASLTD